MPAFRKSPSSRTNLLPYLKSASSKLSILSLSSTSSIGALFTSSTSTSGSSKSIVASGIRGMVCGRDKENSPSPPKDRSKSNRRVAKDKGNKQHGGGAYPEISAPQLTPEALEAVKARFTLVPLAKTDAYVDEENDMVIVDDADFLDMPVVQRGVLST